MREIAAKCPKSWQVYSRVSALFGLKWGFAGQFSDRFAFRLNKVGPDSPQAFSRDPKNRLQPSIRLGKAERHRIHLGRVLP